jgi:hypothetical protein
MLDRARGAIGSEAAFEGGQLAKLAGQLDKGPALRAAQKMI